MRKREFVLLVKYGTGMNENYNEYVSQEKYGKNLKIQYICVRCVIA